MPILRVGVRDASHMGSIKEVDGRFTCLTDTGYQLSMSSVRQRGRKGTMGGTKLHTPSGRPALVTGVHSSKLPRVPAQRTKLSREGEGRLPR